jgi:hypothetical protein
VENAEEAVMSSTPIRADEVPHSRVPAAEQGASDTARRLRMASIAMRAVLILVLAIVCLRVSLPQSETIWTVYDSPADLVRLLLGLAACGWIAAQLFSMPKDMEAHRIWLYLGLAAVPFILICIVGIW